MGTNHLGNVLTTVADRKVGAPTPLDLTILDYYYTDATSVRDYYAFGQEISSRSFNHQTLGTSDSRYGFNSKERDENGEFGSLTHYDYGFRIYNPAIGKFLSVDPLASKYPFYTPYQFAGNMPIKFIDLDGLEPAENPDMNKNVRAALADVLTIVSAVNSQNNRENYPNVHTDLCGTYSSNCILGGLTRKDDSGSEFMSDTNLETAEKFF